ncbi:ORF2 [Sanxia Water Strider Virus 5]|uniref:ORF2 n=1 Tax=Sanxia Water Strider Virus 5 TaxID=1608064 RepID=UPI0005AD5510|nr:ORF2 [Sanxia Water Strider Virus 5]AJG39117.1 ORF2 [Sanxia Water Strider Virus 5]
MNTLTLEESDSSSLNQFEDPSLAAALNSLSDRGIEEFIAPQQPDHTDPEMKKKVQPSNPEQRKIKGSRSSYSAHSASHNLPVNQPKSDTPPKKSPTQIKSQPQPPKSPEDILEIWTQNYPNSKLPHLYSKYSKTISESIWVECFYELNNKNLDPDSLEIKWTSGISCAQAQYEVDKIHNAELLTLRIGETITNFSKIAEDLMSQLQTAREINMAAQLSMQTTIDDLQETIKVLKAERGRPSEKPKEVSYPPLILDQVMFQFGEFRFTIIDKPRKIQVTPAGITKRYPHMSIAATEMKTWPSLMLMKVNGKNLTSVISSWLESGNQTPERFSSLISSLTI